MNINFDAPSAGTVNSSVDAFQVFNSGSGPALRGESIGAFTGIFGTSQQNGVVGVRKSDKDAGVNGSNTGNGFGVFGSGAGGPGVQGNSTNANGVEGHGGKNGVLGLTASDNDSGVVGINNGKGFGVFGSSQGGKGVGGKSVAGNGVEGTGGKNGVLGVSPSSTDSGVIALRSQATFDWLTPT
jgi:hypothetical protein